MTHKQSSENLVRRVSTGTDAYVSILYCV